MDDEIARRIGRNEALYRRVNDSVSSDEADDGSRLHPYLCECGALGCNQVIELTSAEYEAVRSFPTRFFLVDGHEEPEAERVVERHERYAVVEKLGAGAEVARDTDPRA